MDSERRLAIPTDQPTSAPEGIGTDAREADTAAAVMHDDAIDRPAGGGGLRGIAAADPLADGGPGATGATPNSPVDTGVAPPDTDGAAATESRREATQAAPAEPHPRSQWRPVAAAGVRP